MSILELLILADKHRLGLWRHGDFVVCLGIMPRGRVGKKIKHWVKVHEEKLRCMLRHAKQDGIVVMGLDPKRSQ